MNSNSPKNVRKACVLLLIVGIAGGALLYKRSNGRRGLGDNYIPVVESQQDGITVTGNVVPTFSDKTE
jgi:hypothetical protein